MDLEINDLSSVGVVRDLAGHHLPPEAFTLGNNVRFVPDGVARLPGWGRVWSGLTTNAPTFLVQVKTLAGGLWWVYGTASKLFAIDDTPQVVDVSGAAYSGNYWQSTILGATPILNNGTQAPQTWDLNLVNNFQDLSAWPSSTSCGVIRAFGPFLVALDVNKNGSRYPHMVKWSHPADPGSVPASWDETDSTMDAGENDLTDTEAGGIRDGYPLRGVFVIYKERSTWLMRIIGGQQIMQFDQFLATAGVFNRECAQATGDGAYHFVVTEDDIIIHDTNRVQSLLDRRFRSYLFNQINGDYRNLAYVFANPRQREMWFCYAAAGSTVVNRALIWNYGVGTGLGALSEADYSFPWTALGDISKETDVQWQDEVGTWDDAYGAWVSSDLRRPIGVSTAGNRFLLLDSASTRDGQSFEATVRREGLAMLGRKRDGEPIVDFKTRKMVRKLWPKAVGGPLRVRVGGQEVVPGVVNWGPYIAFDPTTQRFVDLTEDGFAIGVEFSSEGVEDWALHGYTVELARTGRF